MKSTNVSMEELQSIVAAIRCALNAKRDALKESLKLSRWRSAEGNFSPAEAKVAQAGWEELDIPYSWAKKDSARGFYCRVEIPEKVTGIPLAGSRAALEMFWATGAQVYVNGEKVYGVDYWADTQVVPIPLAERLKGGETFEIYAQSRQGDGFGFFMIAELRISALDEWLFRLDTFSEELAFTHFLIQNGDVTDPTLIEAFHATLTAFDTGALEREEWDRLAAMINETRTALQPFGKAAKKYRVHLIGHAHIDMNWLWPWQETEELVRRDFEAVDAIMKEFPAVCFSHSQAATYRAMEERHPELFQRIKQRIQAGRWDVTASTWVEGDLNMSGYETLARQFLEAKTYARDCLGVDPQVCWEPDTFGHPATMPQILRQAGVKYYYHCRAGKGYPVFWWEAPDSSRVLVFNDPSGYNGRVFASQVIPGSIEMAQRYGLRTNMYVFGIGDHGGAITREDVRRAISLNESPLLPEIRFSRTVDFYKELEELERTTKPYPVIRGELNTVFEGCYTSHADIKRANRQTEHALVMCEVMASIASAYKAAVPGTGLSETSLSVAEGLTGEVTSCLREAWRRQCFNQFHDILCGCAIGETYAEAVPAAQEARKTADALRNEILAAMVDSSKTDYVTVFNTLSWQRTDVVTLKVSDNPGVASWKTGDQLEDGAGRRVTVQRVGDSIVFVARDVPPFGYKTFRYVGRGTVNDGAGDEEMWKVHFSEMGNPIMKNERYRVEVDRESGTIVSLLDTITGRQLSYTPQDKWVESSKTKGLLNLFEVQYEAPHPMSAWNLGTITRVKRLVRGAKVRVKEQGPVFQSVYIEHQIDNSTICQEVRVYRSLNRVDFCTTVDWNERGSGRTDAPMLRVLFTPKVNAVHHTFDIPFGIIERNPDGREVPAIHWIDVSEESGDNCYGMALLNNCKYGHSIQGNTMSITLVRSSYEPDNEPDVGHHEFTYAMYPHQGGWREANADRRGFELNQPLIAAVGEPARDKGAGRISGALPVEPASPAYSPGPVEETKGTFTALQVEGRSPSGWQPVANVLVTAFKPREGKNGEHGWIVRLQERHGETTSIRLRTAFHVSAVEDVSLTEDIVRTLPGAHGQTIEIGRLRPHEVRTLRLRS